LAGLGLLFLVTAGNKLIPTDSGIVLSLKTLKIFLLADHL